MKATKGAAVLLIVSLVLTWGCAKKAKTPRDALANFFKSQEMGDKTLFIACTYGDNDEELRDAMFESMAETFDHGKRMERAYGKDPEALHVSGKTVWSWKVFMERIQIKEGGDRAQASYAVGMTQTTPPVTQYAVINLIKKAGVWFVDISGEMTKGHQRQAELEYYRKVIKALRGVKDKIGTPGYDPGKIKSEVAAAFR